MPPSEIDVYRDELLNLTYGYPIFEPDPGDEAYIRVGDVGYISRGHFYRLFNAFFDASSPINSKHGVPEHYTPLPLELQTTYQGGSLPIGAHSSKTVSSVHLNFDIQGSMIPVGASIQLSCSSERGAVLILKEPAQRRNSMKEKKLGEELLKHYQTWHAHLRNTFGADIHLREMVFVTGCDLSSDWATLTIREKGMNGELSFKACDPNSVSTTPALGGQWQTTISVPIRSGPDSEHKKLHIRLEGDPEHSKNQCIFLRGWRVSERVIGRHKLRAAAEPKDDEPQFRDEENEIGWLLRVDDDESSDTSCNDAEATHRTQTVYDKAFEKLHKTYSTTDVVLLHDDDIINFIKSESRNVDFSVLTWKFTRRDYEDGVQEEYELTANSSQQKLESQLDDPRPQYKTKTSIRRTTHPGGIVFDTKSNAAYLRAREIIQNSEDGHHRHPLACIACRTRRGKCERPKEDAACRFCISRGIPCEVGIV